MGRPPNKRRPFDRLPNETAAAWKAFQAYCHQGHSAVRNKTALVKELGYSTKRNITKWAREYRWDERVDYYDQYMAEELQKELLIQQKLMVKEHAATAKQIRSIVDKALPAISVADLKPTDLVKLLDLATKIERLSVGMPTEHTKIEDEERDALKDLADWARKKQQQRGDQQS